MIRVPVNENATKVSSSESRINTFRQNIVDFIKEAHRRFLRERGEDELIKEYENSKVWHKDFDLNSEKIEIPMRKIPEKPAFSKDLSVSEFLKNSDGNAIKNANLRRIMKEVAAKEKNNEDSSMDLEKNTKRLGVSEQLIAKASFFYLWYFDCGLD